MAKSLYTLSAIEEYLSKVGEDHEIIQIDEGCLLAGDFIVLPNENEKYVIIREVALNCWSSAYKVECRVDLTDEQQELLDNAYSFVE